MQEVYAKLKKSTLEDIAKFEPQLVEGQVCFYKPLEGKLLDSQQKEEDLYTLIKQEVLAKKLIIGLSSAGKTLFTRNLVKSLWDEVKLDQPHVLSFMGSVAQY